MDIMILCLVFMLAAGISGLDSDEPVCTSRFDYDHKMLQKLILLEIDQTKLREQLEQLKDEIDQTKLREQLEQLKDEISISKAVLEDEITRRIAIEVEKFNQDLDDRFSLRSTGSNYIRWGRNSCPGNGTNLVYKGFAGGSRYIHTGAAANYLCLPEQPLWGVFEDAEQTGHTVWGAEYEFAWRNMNNFFGNQLNNRDVPCSLCHTKRAAALMIPGRNKCYGGWTLEYHGYLMAGYDGHFATEFVCLDADPEALVGGIENQDGKLFYFVEARCGSLRCPPYVNGRELTCAVCSK